MPLALWLSDLHLDRCDEAVRVRFLASIAASPAAPLLITGDISNAARLITDLEAIANQTTAPLYYVLGNHDHFGASIATIRDAIIALSERRPAIQWLPPAGVVELSRGTVLVGVDGWADGRFGRARETPLMLNDDRLIEELAAQHTRAGKSEVRRVLAEADAARLSVLLARAASSGAERILVATHVPPFVEALRAGSRVAHPDWLPLMVCGATGEVLRAFAVAHPAIHLLVLAGHAHLPSQAVVMPNLRIVVAPARYGDPERSMGQIDGTDFPGESRDE